MTTALIVFLTALQILAAVLLSWSGFVTFLGLIRKRRPLESAEHKNRFAVVVCARNEEAVLRHLLKSLENQDYPHDLFHVYLLADHCTDGTAAYAGRYPFVTVWERTDGPQSGKGAVLAWGVAKILREKAPAFDALMVFDADNVARPDFMRKMNAALEGGADLVQGNRLAGEPYRTPVTRWYAIYWTLYSYLYSYPREKLGLSCFLTGTGFAVKKELLQRYGWNTSSITEDVEFAFQQCLRGGRTAFCEEAVCYDEQPSSYRVMIRQLTRWCTGSYQIFHRYLRRWFRAFRRRPSKKLMDNMALLLTGPCSSVMLIASLIVGFMLLTIYPHLWILQAMTFAAGYALTLLAAYLTTSYVGIPIRKLVPGFLTFPVFLYTYQFCSLYALIFPSKKWKPIAHEGLSDCEEEEEEKKTTA